MKREVCPTCGSCRHKKNGHIHNGKQNYLWKDCDRQFVADCEFKTIGVEISELIKKKPVRTQLVEGDLPHFQGRPDLAAWLRRQIVWRFACRFRHRRAKPWAVEFCGCPHPGRNSDSHIAPDVRLRCDAIRCRYWSVISTSYDLWCGRFVKKRPFVIDTWVVLPDHLHCVWTLPPGDDVVVNRWQPRFLRQAQDRFENMLYAMTPIMPRIRN